MVVPVVMGGPVGQVVMVDQAMVGRRVGMAVMAAPEAMRAPEVPEVPSIPTTQSFLALARSARAPLGVMAAAVAVVAADLTEGPALGMADSPEVTGCQTEGRPMVPSISIAATWAVIPFPRRYTRTGPMTTDLPDEA